MGRAVAEGEWVPMNSGSRTTPPTSNHASREVCHRLLVAPRLERTVDYMQDCVAIYQPCRRRPVTPLVRYIHLLLSCRSGSNRAYAAQDYRPLSVCWSNKLANEPPTKVRPAHGAPRLWVKNQAICGKQATFDRRLAMTTPANRYNRYKAEKQTKQLL